MLAPVDKRTLRERLEQRRGQLETERAGFLTHWQDISDHLLPHSGRYFLSDRNRGTKRFGDIIDNTGTLAHAALAAGLMARANSKGRPWFRVQHPDPDLNRYRPVKIYADGVTRRIRALFERANTYRALHQDYEEMAAYGTAVDYVMEDPYTTIRHYPTTVGTFLLAQDHRREIDCCYREFEMSVAQAVKQWGLERVSDRVKNLWHTGKLEGPVGIIHVIEPREDRDSSMLDNLNMEWRSVYYERGAHIPEVLSESGFDYFPVLAPRWSVTDNNTYGHGPGMYALGDIRGLQHKHKRLAQMMNHRSDPARQGPTSLKNQPNRSSPGSMTFVDSPNNQAAVRPLWDPVANLGDMFAYIEDDRARINRTFYRDLFLMLEAMDAGKMTATEAAIRQEEKFTMIGPVQERLQDEMHEPLINIAFRALERAGELPPPPPEIEGQDLNIEFVSSLVQALKASDATATERFIGTLQVVSQTHPQVTDKFDADKWVDDYADQLGIAPYIIVDNRQLQDVRAARERRNAALEQTAALREQAATAKDLSAAKTDEQNALTDAMQGAEPSS